MLATGAEQSQTSLEQAHAAVRANEAYQFEFDALAERPRDPPPEWVGDLFRFLEFLAPAMKYVFWAGVAIIAGLVLWALLQTLMRWRSAQPRMAGPEVPAAPQTYAPTRQRAHALLEEADRLATEGRFGEAVRVLLHRSIEDFERLFPVTIGPDATSREIARLQNLSAEGRSVFSGIAEAVERSLFAGERLDAGAFAQCRSAYAGFALKDARA